MQPDETAVEVTETLSQLLGEPHGGTVALHEPEFAAADSRYVLDCIESGWVSSVGAYVDRFEADLARVAGVRKAVAVVNGTAALHLSLLLVGVRPGDEVLMPALTFVATANAVAYAGAVPHFVDSDAYRLSVDAEKLRAYLQSCTVVRGGELVNRQSGRTIRAIVVLHVFGHPANLQALQQVADEFGLPIVEDAAEALGSTYGGAHVGGFGVAAALSFNGNKIVTTGGGGAVLTNDVELGERAKHLSTTARVSAGWEFVHDATGYNYRMPNLNAALGVAQLERLDGYVSSKRVLADRYHGGFSGVRDVDTVREPEDSASNYWLNAIKVKDRETRDAVLSASNAAGFMTRPCWTLMHKLEPYANCPRADLRTAESLVDRLASKLIENGKDLNGWLRLIRARTVLGERDKAAKALSEARSKFEGDSNALGLLNDFAAKLGLETK